MSQGFTKGTPIDTDPTLSLDSDIVVPSQSAVKAYVASQVGTPVTDVTATAPLVSSSGTTPNLSMPAATTSVDGYLTSTDWDTFNDKQATITGAATTITTSDLTVNKALISNASGKVAVSSSVVGYNLATLTDPSAIRYLKINADNTVALRTAAEMVSDLGLGTGSVSVLSNSQNASNTPASSTYFGCLFGGALSIVSADTLRRTPISTAGTLSRLYVQTSTAQPATGSLVCTVRKNSTDQALTLTIAAGSAAGVFNDLVNSVSVAQGDLLGMKFQNNATTVSGNVLSNQVLLTI
jgi:hypothetical protein